MNRRTMLGWISSLLAAACTAVVAVPGILYRLSMLRDNPAVPNKKIVQRVALLAELPLGKPVQRIVTGEKQDAWTRYPEEKIGTVWLINKSEEGATPEEAEVVAFSAVCPHEGCEVAFRPGQDQFVCPCHGATFHTSGTALTEEELGMLNPSPRGLDPLDCKIVHDEATDTWSVEVTYEKFQKGLAQQAPIS